MRSVADVLPRRLIDRDTPGVKTMSVAGSAVRVVARSVVRGQFLGGPDEGRAASGRKPFHDHCDSQPHRSRYSSGLAGQRPAAQWVAELAASESST